MWLCVIFAEIKTPVRILVLVHPERFFVFVIRVLSEISNEYEFSTLKHMYLLLMNEAILNSSFTRLALYRLVLVLYKYFVEEIKVF